MVKVFVKILEVPPAALMPAVTMISMVGIFSLTGSYFDLILVVAFGVLGYVLRKMDIPTVPVILGILLGGKMEKSLRDAMVLSDGSAWGLIYTRPSDPTNPSMIASGLLIAAVLGFVAPMFLRRILRKPQRVSD
jgi:putative tricarboxylic transport membrane protein